MRLLVNQLRSQDRVAIAVYAGAAGLVLESTPGSDRRAILSAIDELQAGGSTAGSQGIQLAYEVASKSFIRGGINRVVLATDGDFNVGVSSRGGLEELIEEKRDSGIFLTVLGFGMGTSRMRRWSSWPTRGTATTPTSTRTRKRRKSSCARWERPS
jgi:Ca-activated chloride channel family protein